MKTLARFLVLALLALALPAFSASYKSPSAQQTSLTTTNAYTALKWDFGSAGRKYGQSDTLIFVSDSVAGSFVRTRDVGPMARNQQSVNYFLPDSMRMCIEMARVDADTNTTLGFFWGSVNGGTYFSLPPAQSGPTTDLGPASRGLYCFARRFVPGIWIKPQTVISTATDTNVVYSATLYFK